MAVQPLLAQATIPFQDLRIYINPFMAFGNTIPNINGTEFFTTSGGPTKQNGYFSYDGANDYAFLSAQLGTSVVQGSWTQSCWFRSTAVRGDGQIIFTMENVQTGTGGGTWDKQLYIDKDTGKGRFGVFASGNPRTIETLSAIDDSRWHHAVFTHTASYCEAWIDNVFQGSMPYGSVTQSQGWVRFGSYKMNTWPGTGDGYFEGDIGIYLFYTRVIHPTEIATIYEAQKRFYT